MAQRAALRGKRALRGSAHETDIYARLAAPRLGVLNFTDVAMPRLNSGTMIGSDMTIGQHQATTRQSIAGCDWLSVVGVQGRIQPSPARRVRRQGLHCAGLTVPTKQQSGTA